VDGGGLLAKPGDVDDFASKVRALVDDGVLRAKMGTNAFDISRRSYSWDMRAAEIATIYKNVLERINL